MNKIIERINKLNLIERFSLDNKKIILIFIVSLALLYFDCNFLLKGQMAGIAKSKSEIIKISNEFKALDAGLKNMQAVKSGTGKNFKARDKKIIFESELVSLMHDISKLANVHNVRILQIKPTREAQKAVAVKFAPVLINMDLICGYHNLGMFINGLENSQVFISAESFKIEPQPQDPLRQKVSLSVKTYVRK